jgi:hypothetical protein
MTDLQERDSLALALARTRSELSPSSADKERLRMALGLRASSVSLDAAAAAAEAPAAAAGEAAAPAGLTAFAALRASGRLGASLGAALFAAGIATGWGLHWQAGRDTRHAGERATTVGAAIGTAAPVAVSAPAPATAAVAALAPAGPAPERSEALHLGRAVQRPGGRASALPARASVKPLDAELALLRRVERALRNAEPALALALLSELDERYPHTRLAEERLAARTIADCGLDQPEAAAHAHAFLREHPASVYSERVQSACATETTGGGSAR